MTRVLAVVGGGIIGLAVARELTRRHPDDEVVVLEKELAVGTHQTSHNSGVVHAGVYYPAGSLKAELCTRGRAMLREYAAEHRLPYDECGKLVVALDESELPRLEALADLSLGNGVPGLARLDADQMLDVEPAVSGLAALHSPATAITDYHAIARSFAADVMRAGGRVALGTTVTGIRRERGRITVATDRGTQRVDRVVVCAGLHADRVSQLADGRPGPRIVPFRGEYLTVDPAKAGLVRGMVYPVPDPRYPFLGVHFTRTVRGELEVGPNAVLGLAREAYARGDRSLRDVRELAGWPGFRRLAREHWRTGVREMRAAASLSSYMAAASRYVPDIGPDDVRPGRTGVRAQAVDRDGTLVDDFRIHHEDGVTTVRNAPSPAATACLAIAEHVVDRTRG